MYTLFKSSTEYGFLLQLVFLTDSHWQLDIFSFSPRGSEVLPLSSDRWSGQAVIWAFVFFLNF